MKNLLPVLFIFIVMFLTSCNSSGILTEEELQEKGYQEVIGVGVIDENHSQPDHYAMYPGGINGVYKAIAKNVRYPKNAYWNNIQGKVIVAFVVDENGHVNEANVINSVSEVLDNEALRVVLKLDNWHPGFLNGEPACVRYQLPITFNIN